MPGKCCAAARGSTTPVSAALHAAPGTSRTTTTAALGSVFAYLEDDSLGKPCAAARGSAAPGSADRPAASGSSRTSTTAALGSVSAASSEDDSLGKPCAAARGSAPPGTAARPAAPGTSRTTTTATLGSVSVAFGLKLLRGGSWGGHPGPCRSASRDGFHPDDRGIIVGFRVCCLPHV